MKDKEQQVKQVSISGKAVLQIFIRKVTMYSILINNLDVLSVQIFFLQVVINQNKAKIVREILEKKEKILNMICLHIVSLIRELEEKVKKELDKLQKELADKNSEQIKELQEQIENEQQEKELELR